MLIKKLMYLMILHYYFSIFISPFFFICTYKGISCIMTTWGTFCNWFSFSLLQILRAARERDPSVMVAQLLIFHQQLFWFWGEFHYLMRYIHSTTEMSVVIIYLLLLLYIYYSKLLLFCS